MMEWMQSEDIRRLVEGAPADTLRDFVIRIAERRLDIQTLLVSAFEQGSADAHWENLKEQIGGLVWKYAGKTKFVEYKDASDFTYEMEELLETQVAVLIGRETLQTRLRSRLPRVRALRESGDIR